MATMRETVIRGMSHSGLFIRDFGQKLIKVTKMTTFDDFYDTFLLLLTRFGISRRKGTVVGTVPKRCLFPLLFSSFPAVTNFASPSLF